MDVIIPSHSIKTFCSAITSLGKISGGKDLYIEFHPVSGLSLRTLNDAKSAYSIFHYDPSFFERCTYCSTTSSRLDNNSRKKRPHPPPTDGNDNANDDDNEEEEEGRVSCRAPFKAMAAVVRPRKNVYSLRIKSETKHNYSFLSFEFTIQPNSSSNNSSSNSTLLTATHRIQIADTANIISAVAPTENASEIISSPQVLLKLLEPLQRTSTCAAFIIRYKDDDNVDNVDGNNGNNGNNNNNGSSVSASSFYHNEYTTNTNESSSSSRGNNNNAILQATSASLLKSETACGIDEFIEFDYVNNRNILDDEENIPDDINTESILVFPIKECKSILQFCKIQELPLSIKFYWGGKPIVLDVEGDSFTAQLVLATLDYSLLTSLRTTE